MSQKSKPVAVLISDVHYSLATLELSDTSVRLAIAKANELEVPLIVAGDLHDTKANMRAECVNAMLNTFRLCEQPSYIIRGNHCSVNEKSTESALNFLDDFCTVVNTPVRIEPLISWQPTHLIPYHHDPEALLKYLATLAKGSLLIMHQGISGSSSGEYIHDKSAIPTTALADFRVISGHYHTRQTIKCGPLRSNHVGQADYIGNPYTLNYAEHRDPPKGFQVLRVDGGLEFVPTNLRKHVVIEGDISVDLLPSDLVWVKVSGTRQELHAVTKKQIGREYGITQPFRLDLIPTDSLVQHQALTAGRSQAEILDSIIGSLSDSSEERKERLQALWKEMSEKA